MTGPGLSHVYLLSGPPLYDKPLIGSRLGPGGSLGFAGFDLSVGGDASAASFGPAWAKRSGRHASYAYCILISTCVCKSGLQQQIIVGQCSVGYCLEVFLDLFSVILARQTRVFE